MTKPTSIPGWVATGATSEPSSARKTNGFASGATGYKPDYQEFNWFWALVSDWIAYLDAGLEVEFYVNQSTGSDSNDGSSSGSPFQTIAKAVSEIPVNGSGIIKLSDETHYISTDSASSIFKNKAFELQAISTSASLQLEFEIDDDGAGNTWLFHWDFENTEFICPFLITMSNPDFLDAWTSDNYMIGLNGNNNNIVINTLTFSNIAATAGDPVFLKSLNDGKVNALCKGLITTNTKGYFLENTVSGTSNIDAGEINVATLTPIDNAGYWLKNFTSNASFKHQMFDKQRIVFDANTGSGTFFLKHAGNSTGTIAYNASASTIKTALEGLASITSVSVILRTTGGSNIVEIEVTFADEGEKETIIADINTLGGATYSFTAHERVGYDPGIVKGFRSNVQLYT